MRTIIITLFILIIRFSIQAQVVYVTQSGAGQKDGSSWENALAGNDPTSNGFTVLATYFKEAVAGEQFWIAEGTYKPCTDNDREKYFSLNEDIAIYGGFAGNETNLNQRNFKLHPSVFSGNIGLDSIDSDNCYHVFATSGPAWTNSATLDGIHIIQGYAGNSSYNYRDWRNSGAGIYNGHKLTLINDEFTDCFASQSGGAIFNGGINNLTNCLFYKNQAESGGGICVPYTTNPSIKQAIINSCTFSNNSATIYGGAICNGGVSEVINCLIVNNSASNGGGMYNGNANMWYIRTEIYNSTIANNSSALLFNWGSAKIYNSIIWGDEIATWNSPSLDFRNICIQNSIAGVGMLNVNPLFINPTLFTGTGSDGLQADWHLSLCSPVRDMGDNSLIPAGITTDLEGNPRILYNVVDMGPYEFDTTGINPRTIAFNNNRIYVSDSKTYSGDGSSWSTALAGNESSCQYLGQNLLYEALKDANPGTEIWIKRGKNYG